MEERWIDENGVHWWRTERGIFAMSEVTMTKVAASEFESTETLMGIPIVWESEEK